jgi:prepilin-type processing-associated H-X9-DG protein
VLYKREMGPGWGWATRSLPDLDQQPLYDAINLNVNIEDKAHATTRVVMLSTFVCPTDDMPRVWDATVGSTWMELGQIVSRAEKICDVAGANYVGVFGIAEPGVDGEGIFFRGSAIRPQDIPDGLSHTMAVGERSVTLNSGRGMATWVGAVPGALLWSCAPDPFDPDGGICRKEDGSGMILGHTGEGHGPGDTRGDVNQFLSMHGKGAHFVFCDGHVKFLRNGMNYKTYKALSTRKGREAVPDEF